MARDQFYQGMDSAKPLPESMITKFYEAVWYHQASMSSWQKIYLYLYKIYSTGEGLISLL